MQLHKSDLARMCAKQLQTRGKRKTWQVTNP